MTKAQLDLLLALGREAARRCERDYVETGEERYADRSERWRDLVTAATPEGTE